MEKDAALERRFQPVQVGEPSIEDAVQILDGLRGRYEEHHGVRYTDEAIRAAVELSARYVTDRFLPDKAIDLIDQAGARLSIKLGSQTDVAVLREQLASLEMSKNDAAATERYEGALRLRDEIEAVNRKLSATNSSAPEASEGSEAVVSEADIAGVISRSTGIPTSRLTEDDREHLARLEEELHQRIVGQDDAVTLIAKAVRRSCTGMGNADRPLQSQGITLEVSETAVDWIAERGYEPE